MNKIRNIKNRNIISSFDSLKTLIEYIKSSDRPEYESILDARKSGKGTSQYQNIKQNKIPCVAINFKHSNGKINGDTVNEPTGYMFFDLDNENNMTEDITYIAGYWKSLSNTGYSVIVKTKGLDKDNLKASYEYVGNMIGLNYDKNAISKDRLTILSYDDEAYYNENAREINLSEFNSTQANKEINRIKSKKKETQHNSNKYSPPCYECNGSILRFNDLDEQIEKSGVNIEFDENGMYDFGADNKIEYSKVFYPFKNVEKGKRNKCLSSYTHMIIALNKNILLEQLSPMIHSLNNKKCTPPLPNSEVEKMIKDKFNKRNSIKPFEQKKLRRFIFDDTKIYAKYEKQKYVAKKIGKQKSERTRAKIKLVIQNWDFINNPKITNKKIVEITNMNRKTIVKYCSSILKELGINRIGKMVA